eukprot:1178089-Rhodomonas_salina.1
MAPSHVTSHGPQSRDLSWPAQVPGARYAKTRSRLMQFHSVGGSRPLELEEELLRVGPDLGHAGGSTHVISVPDDASRSTVW